MVAITARTRQLLSTLSFTSLFLASCNQPRPADCATIEQEVHDCIDQGISDSIASEVVFDDCVPLADEETLHGTWVSDFELNAFYENKIYSADEQIDLESAYTSLEVEGTELDQYLSDDMYNVLEVRFVGRRTLCDFTAPYRQIVVTRILETEIIREQPSAWQLDPAKVKLPQTSLRGAAGDVAIQRVPDWIASLRSL